MHICAYVCIFLAYFCILWYILCILLHIPVYLFLHINAYFCLHICAYNCICAQIHCMHSFRLSPPHFRGGIMPHHNLKGFAPLPQGSLASCEGLPSSSISGSSRREPEGRGVVTACAGSCVRRKCWVPEESGSVLLSCVCVRTRNYGATQRFHKLNIHSFMPERPHKRNCPEMTQDFFR